MKRILLAISFCLLVSSTANAECAWVLWKKTDTTGNPGGQVSWEIQDALPQYQQCRQQQMVLCNSMKQVYSPEHNAVLRVDNCPTRIFAEVKGGAVLMDFFCLPDTMDPRK
jgi:hypothetical protein